MSVMLPLSQKGMIGDYAQLDAFLTQICQRLLPGPVTLILPKGTRVPEWYFPETDLIGIRIPDESEVQTLLEAFAGPLITTSANPSGQPVCRSAEEVAKVFEGQADLLSFILKSDRVLGHQPSTIIQILPSAASENTCTELGRSMDSRLRILREGPWTEKEIRHKLEGLRFEMS